MIPLSNPFSSLATIRDNPVVRGSVVMFVASMVVNVSNFLYTAIMGRMLGPADYGVLTALTSLLYIVSVPSQSLNTVTVTFVSRFFAVENRYAVWRLLRKAFLWLVLMSTVLITGMIIFQTEAAQYLNIPDARLLVLLAVLVAVSFLNVLMMSVVQGLQRFSLYGMVAVAVGLTKLGLGVVLVWLGYRVVGALLAFIGSMILPAVLLAPTLFSLRTAATVDTQATQRDVLRFALPTLIAYFGLALLINQDVVLVKRFFTPEEAGLYAALALIGKIIFFAVGAVVAVVYPMVAAQYAAHESVSSPVRLGLALISLICGGALVVYVLVPGLVVQILFGSAYTAITPLVWQIGLFLSVYSLAYALILFLLALDQVIVVFLPVLFAFVQYMVLVRYHSSLEQVVQVSLASTTALLLSVAIVYSARRGRFSAVSHEEAITTS